MYIIYDYLIGSLGVLLSRADQLLLCRRWTDICCGSLICLVVVWFDSLSNYEERMTEKEKTDG